MRVLIIGGTSPIADGLIRQCLKANYTTKVLVGGNTYQGPYKDRLELKKHVIGKTPVSQLRNWLDPFDIVWIIPPIDLAVKIIPALIEAGTKRIICVSSYNVVVTPHDPVYANLLSAESYITTIAPNSIIIRPTMIIHRNQALLRLVANRISKGKIVFMPGMGKTIQQPIDYRDLSDALYFAAHQSAPGCYNVGGSTILSLRKLYSRFAKVSDQRLIIIPVPIFLIKVAKYFFSNRLPLSSAQISRLSLHKSIESNALPGWLASTPLDETLETLIDFIR